MPKIDKSKKESEQCFSSQEENSLLTGGSKAHTRHKFSFAAHVVSLETV